ncbi:hypothetical protein GGTG_09734 [Gaeumannomyces tritici R3-111a-1]|uniref:Uncharacterized protein n=1 Tax=Gaeumannomyces tritici (strain R3-111a-1) TaxID=644352 RepID=J3P8A0_GAET3|nr:hypothetical protein GGTG_09734 [Gaeumannomyces tritici R3-111a-1]EJT72883.1 hypothetical protein GGTG_09734 [Gaeumannomyces tritici R3-111a-1]
MFVLVESTKSRSLPLFSRLSPQRTRAEAALYQPGVPLAAPAHQVANKLRCDWKPPLHASAPLHARRSRPP